MNEKPIILVICDYYLPGYQSGGGMRTIVNMVDRLQDRYDFRIVTRDHDGKLDRQPYTTVRINEWNALRGAQVYYLSKDNVKISKLGELVREVEPAIIYFNSYFATLAIYVLLLRRFGKIKRPRIVLAPCGELSAGALQIKPGKKMFFENGEGPGLYRDIVWKASSELEKAEIERQKGTGGAVLIAPDLPPRAMFEKYSGDLKPIKKEGEATMVFLSRFVRKKNLKWLIPHLSQIEGRLTIDVWGPLEDLDYWEECEDLIRSLPPNIRVQAKGIVPHEMIYEVLVKYHFFLLPTLGENFGHVFLEALAAGCPLLISDQTPWLNLEDKGIGWELGLDDPSEWVRKINRCIGLGQRTYSELSANSRAFVLDWLRDPQVEESTLSVLEFALQNTLSPSSQIA